MRRWLFVLGSGLAASLAAGALLPVRPGSGLRATLVALPLVVALFAALRRSLAAPAPRGVERLLGAAWLVVALEGDRLCLPRHE